MFSLNESNRFVLCMQGVDLRKGIDGLRGYIRQLSLLPTSGDVYVFVNKNRNTMKLVHWERGGFVIWNAYFAGRDKIFYLIYFIRFCSKTERFYCLNVSVL